MNLTRLVTALALLPTLAYASISTPTIVDLGSSYQFKFNYTGTPSYLHIFIDSNNSASSGHAVGGIGADYMLENNRLYKFTGSSGSSWSWSQVSSVNFTKIKVSPKSATWIVAKSLFGSPAQFKIVGHKNNVDENSSIVSYIASSTTTGGSSSGGSVSGGSASGSSSSGGTVSGGSSSGGTVSGGSSSGGTVSGGSSSSGGSASGGLVTYVPGVSTATFANPERGFHNYFSSKPDVSVPSAYSFASKLAAGQSLAIMIVDLGNFFNASISATALANYQTMFNNARTAGVKLTLLHKYHDNGNNSSDPTEARMLGHIAQLAPIMSANADVIYTVHAGFIGAWGEWYYTQHNDAVRKNIIMALLNGLPASITVGIRTPAYKINLFDMTAPNVANLNASAASRVGHHNDCFLASSDDEGTGGDYELTTPSDWRDFIRAENQTLSIPVGGETCGVSSYSTCSNAKIQLARMGYSYLNLNYHPDVIAAWKTGGCFDEITQKLGYRLKLNQAQLPAQVSRSGNLVVSLQIENLGYAALVNTRPVKLVLYNANHEYTIDLTQNPKNWKTGIHTISQQVNLAQQTIEAGDYNVAIWMPDSAVGLQARPSYSIQFANSSTWDSVKGRNILKNSSNQNVILKITP